MEYPISSLDSSDSMKQVKSLIEAHKFYLSSISSDKFLISTKDKVCRLPSTFIEKLLKEIKKPDKNNKKNLLTLAQDNNRLYNGILDYLRDFEEEIREADATMRLGIAFPCLESEDRKFYVASYIYPLEYEYHGEPYLSFGKPRLENEQLRKELNKSFENIAKTKNTSKFDTELGLDLLSFIIQVVELGIPLELPLLNVGLTVYGGISILKKLHKRFSPVEIEDENETSEVKEDKVAILFAYSDADYTKNCAYDYKDISECIKNFHDKLLKLWEKILPVDEFDAELNFTKRHFIPLEPNLQITSSQRFNYGRMAIQEITAIQGPPGTGKTQLIAQFCLDNIFARYLSEFKSNPDLCNTVLITSTNNKAVDNVMEKLEEFDNKYKSNLLTGQYLKGYLRLGSRENIALAIEKQLNSLLTPIDKDEIKKNIECLNNEIKKHLEFVEGYKGKQVRLVELKKAIKGIENQINEYEAQGQNELNSLNMLSQELFTDSSKASEFNRDNLISFEQLLSRLNKFYSCLPYLRDLIKKKLYRFAEDKGIKLSGLKDFQYLSCKDLYKRNESLRLGLKEFISYKEKIAHLKDACDKLSQQKDSLLKESFNISEELEKEKNSFDEKIVELFLRLREYSFWKLKSDDNFMAKIYKNFKSNESKWKIYREILRLSPVIVSTSLSVRNSFPCEKDIFDTVIVDEAGQTFLTYSIPLFLRGRHFVAIGDRFQLGPVQREFDIKALNEKFSNIPDHLHYCKSILETAEEIDTTEPARRRLLEHFRCNRKIIDFCNTLINYDLVITTSDRLLYEPKKTPPDFLANIFTTPLIFINVVGERKKVCRSNQNKSEMEMTIKFLGVLKEYVDLKDMAVLTPYRGQAELINKALKKIKVTEVLVGTVHKLQGDERDIVIMNAVLTSPDEIMRSLLWSKKELVNVAVSRAKKHLILIGNEKGIKDIENKEVPLYLLYEHIKDNGIVINGEELLNKLSLSKPALK